MNLYKTIALIGIGYMLRDQQTHRPYSYRVYDQSSVSRHLKQILNDKLDLLFYGNCEWRPVMTRPYGNPRRYYPYFDYTKLTNNDTSIIDPIYFDNKKDAEHVLDLLKNIIDKYGSATLSDYYDAANSVLGRQVHTPPSYVDSKLEWRRLSDARICKAFNKGWMISLPEPMDYYKEIRLSNDSLDEEPYVITEEEYEERNPSIGKRTYFVYDNGCTGELTFELISDERIAKLIGMELLEKARGMITDQIMYVRNEKIEMDFELIRAEGNFEINSDEE